MMKKGKIIFLIALTVLLICFSHFLYEEIMTQIFFRKIWREFFISPTTQNFRCWSYEFFSNSLPSECNEKSLVLNEKIKFCRESLNKIYRNYTKNKDWNETEFITNLVGRAMSINLVETLYANLEDITPREKCDEKDITAIISRIYYPIDYEEVNKMSMTSEIIGFYTIKTYYFFTLTKAFFHIV